MNINLSLDMDFDLENFDAAEKKQKAQALKSRAYATRSRIHARRAKSETVLAEILPNRIEMGESWHVISSGDVDSLSYLAHLLKTQPMRYIMLSTWCMALEDVRQIAIWIASGKIGRVDAYVGEIFPGQYAEAYAELVNTCRACGGRVAIFRNHSKLFLCESGQGGGWVIESSANINTNPRTENTCITGSLDLFRHHKTYFDEIKSFNRDFDNWEPFNG